MGGSKGRGSKDSLPGVVGSVRGTRGLCPQVHAEVALGIPRGGYGRVRMAEHLPIGEGPWVFLGKKLKIMLKTM